MLMTALAWKPIVLIRDQLDWPLSTEEVAKEVWLRAHDPEPRPVQLSILAHLIQQPWTEARPEASNNATVESAITVSRPQWSELRSRVDRISLETWHIPFEKDKVAPATEFADNDARERFEYQRLQDPIEFLAIPVRIYVFNVSQYHDVRIIVPEDYDRALDEIRLRRAAIEARGVNAQSIESVLAQERLLPEDLIQALDRLPSCICLSRIILREDANPAALCHGSVADDPDCRSIASASIHEISIHRKGAGFDLFCDMAHAWAHLYRNHCGLRSLFDLAVDLEFYGYHPCRRALVNEDENFAVLLGDELLSLD
jgi:hypothetical protein